MRRLTRTGLAVLGLSLSAPFSAWADPPVAPGLAPAGPSETMPAGPITLEPGAPPAYSPTGSPNAVMNGVLGMPSVTPTPVPARAKATAAKGHGKHRKGLLFRCKCPDCQRAAVLARDGVNVPPPPSAAEMVMTEGPASGKCAACEGQGGAVIMEGPVTVMESGNAPGRAVVGDQAPGFAVVGESAPAAEPAPIGVVQSRLAAMGQPPRGPVAAAPRDAMFTPSSMASNPVKPPGHNRPHVISHMLGIEAIGKRKRQARERAREERHAAIPYGPQTEQPVTELPASVVYGRRGH